MASCANCGTQGVVLKRCGGCRQFAYCGAECQKAAWRGGHKATCGKPLPSPQEVAEFRAKVMAAGAVYDWQEVLKWEGRMDELVANLPDEDCETILLIFITAHAMVHLATGGTRNALAIARLRELRERHVDLLGKMQRFRDQGETMCQYACIPNVTGKREEGERWFNRARDVGAAHGFFSVESSACLGLGDLAMNQGRHEEGVELLRNALVATNLSEHEGEEKRNQAELNVLHSLSEALFKIAAIDEVEPLVLRYRELAKAETARIGGLQYKMWSFYLSARLHEVPCICSPSRDPVHTARPMQSTKTSNA